MQTQRYTNGVLTVVGGLLALNLVAGHHFRGTDLGPSIAQASAAQPESYRRDGSAERPAAHMDPTEGGLISAAEQRKLMLAELRTLNARLASIETKLGAGVNVTVTDMPAIQWPAQQADASDTTPAPTGTP